MKTETTNLTSIALFGSVVRGDFDKYSDKDILLVGNKSLEINSLKNQLGKNKWSCASYTWDKLNYLKSQQSLFIQHLKKESWILHDHNENYKTFLSNYNPKSDYTKEYYNSNNLFKSLEYLNDNHYSNLWALDVLSVGFRNLAIFRLANEGIYEFSHKSIIQSLHKIGLINHEDIPLLLKLRVLKRLFRKKTLFVFPTQKETLQLIETVNKCFKIGLESKVLKSDDFSDKILSLVNKPNHFDNYQKIRSIEAYMIANKIHNERLDKIISNPQENLKAFANHSDEYFESLNSSSKTS